MNAAIQCLFATHRLTSYFASGDFRTELSVNNPLGMGGALAQSYADLIKEMLSPTQGCTTVSPIKFKSVIGKSAPHPPSPYNSGSPPASADSASRTVRNCLHFSSTASTRT
jgi:ubiquitin C-terminal hydrolase